MNGTIDTGGNHPSSYCRPLLGSRNAYIKGSSNPRILFHFTIHKSLRSFRSSVIKVLANAHKLANMLAIISLLTLATAAFAAPVADGPILGVTLGGAAATTTAIGPNPTQVTINSISYGGTGCPQGTVGSFISADRST